MRGETEHEEGEAAESAASEDPMAQREREDGEQEEEGRWERELAAGAAVGELRLRRDLRPSSRRVSISGGNPASTRGVSPSVLLNLGPTRLPQHARESTWCGD